MRVNFTKNLLYKFFEVVAIGVFAVAVPHLAQAYEAHLLPVTATLTATPVDTISDPTSQCEIVNITGTQTSSSLSYDQKSVVVKKGAKIIPSLSNLNVYAGCDFILEEGALIDFNNTENGFLRINAGNSIYIAGKIIARSTGTGSSMRISANQDIVFDGSIDTSGNNAAGVIRFDAGNDLLLRSVNGASIIANSDNGIAGTIRLNSLRNLVVQSAITARSIQSSGGSLRTAISGTSQLGGTYDLSGATEGGSIRLSGDNSITFNNAKVYLNATAGQGGILLIDTKKDFNFTGFVDAVGARSGGSIVASIGHNATFDGKFDVSGVGAQSSGGTIGINANGGKLTTRGTMIATGTSGNGSIDLTYCSKDLINTSFTPAPNLSGYCLLVNNTAFDLMSKFVAPLIATAQELFPFSLNTETIAFEPLFLGEKVYAPSTITIAPELVNKKITYQITKPTSNACSAITLTTSENSDTLAAATLNSVNDTSDQWTVTVQAPELTQETLVSSASTVNTLDALQCAITFASVSVEDISAPPSSGGGGSGNSGGGSTPPPPAPNPTPIIVASSGGGGGLLTTVLNTTWQANNQTQNNNTNGNLVMAQVNPPSVIIKEIGTDYFIVTFITNYPTLARIVYDTRSHESDRFGYPLSTREDSSVSSVFEILNNGLQPNTDYYFRIVTRTGSSETYSNEYYVRTQEKAKTVSHPSNNIGTIKNTLSSTSTATTTSKSLEPIASLRSLLASLASIVSKFPIQLWIGLLIILGIIGWQFYQWLRGNSWFFFLLRRRKNKKEKKEA